MRRPLATILAAASAVRASRKPIMGERLVPAHEMVSCIRLARRWAQYPERASVAADLAAIWANDAINGE